MCVCIAVAHCCGLLVWIKQMSHFKGKAAAEKSLLCHLHLFKKEKKIFAESEFFSSEVFAYHKPLQTIHVNCGNRMSVILKKYTFISS